MITDSPRTGTMSSAVSRTLTGHNNGVNGVGVGVNKEEANGGVTEVKDVEGSAGVEKNADEEEEEMPKMSVVTTIILLVVVTVVSPPFSFWHGMQEKPDIRFY